MAIYKVLFLKALSIPHCLNISVDHMTVYDVIRVRGVSLHFGIYTKCFYLSFIINGMSVSKFQQL